MVGSDPDADWRQPPPASPDAKATARDLSSRLTASLDGRAADRTVARWLTQVGMLTAGKMSLDEAKARISAYSAMLEFPEACYSPESLKRAGSKFKFFPSFAEVEEHLSREVWWIKAQAYRLHLIGKEAEAPKPAAEATRDAGPAIKAAIQATAVPPEKSKAQIEAEFQRQKAEVLRQCEAAGMVDDSAAASATPVIA